MSAPRIRPMTPADSQRTARAALRMSEIAVKAAARLEGEVNPVNAVLSIHVAALGVAMRAGAELQANPRAAFEDALALVYGVLAKDAANLPGLEEPRQ